MEESGTYLEADGKDKKDKAELLDKVKDVEVGFEAEMAHENAGKENPGTAKRNALYLESAKIKTNTDHEGDKQYRVGDSLPKKKIMHYSSILTRKQVLSFTLPSTYQVLPSCMEYSLTWSEGTVSFMKLIYKSLTGLPVTSGGRQSMAQTT